MVPGQILLNQYAYNANIPLYVAERPHVISQNFEHVAFAPCSCNTACKYCTYVLIVSACTTGRKFPRKTLRNPQRRYSMFFRRKCTWIDWVNGFRKGRTPTLIWFFRKFSTILLTSATTFSTRSSFSFLLDLLSSTPLEKYQIDAAPNLFSSELHTVFSPLAIFVPFRFSRHIFQNFINFFFSEWNGIENAIRKLFTPAVYLYIYGSCVPREIAIPL